MAVYAEVVANRAILYNFDVDTMTFFAIHISLFGVESCLMLGGSCRL